MKRQIKFVIVSPRQKWGGAIVLHALCKYLSEAGYDARIFYTEVYEYKQNKKIKFWVEWIYYCIKDLYKILTSHFISNIKNLKSSQYSGYIDIAIKGCKRKYMPFVDKDTIVVYPDTVYGNFLTGDKVVRWFLYYNRYKNQKGAYGKKDLFFCYRDIFNDERLNPKYNKLNIAYFDKNLYKQFNFGMRKGNCYILRKGKKRNDIPKKFDGPIIDDFSEIEKVRILNLCKYCYIYDLQTAYGTIAALCGCIPIIVLPDGMSKNDILSNGEQGFGKAYGTSQEEINIALNTRRKMIKGLEREESLAKVEVNKFINMCREHFQIDTSE